MSPNEQQEGRREPGRQERDEDQPGGDGGESGEQPGVGGGVRNSQVLPVQGRLSPRFNGGGVRHGQPDTLEGSFFLTIT